MAAPPPHPHLRRDGRHGREPEGQRPAGRGAQGLQQRLSRTSPERTFLGHSTPISAGSGPIRRSTSKSACPTLEPGRFQGVFFENVETEYTKRIMAPRPRQSPRRRARSSSGPFGGNRARVPRA
ncbi:MAG: hypothetical protein M0C28_25275 [Candidatus Moduliflexus flocculans]|nr:hypothetical protein [Candidatus Moduliflexus flocculans]